MYDTSGPYGDPEINIDVRQGLAKLRQPWIDARNDCAPLNERSSAYTKARLADDGFDELRFGGLLTPKRAVAGKCVTQLHYARQGIVTPEMEFIAIRENMGRERIRSEGCASSMPEKALAPACRTTLPPSSSAMKSLPGEPSSRPISITGIRADDYRPQLPGESECQYRQLGGDLFHRRRSRSWSGQPAGAPTR